MVGSTFELFRTQCKKSLIDIISFKAAFLFFSFQKGRYFTVYKRRNKRHSEPQTLYLFVEAKECRNSGLSYDTHEILTPMRKTVIFSCVASATRSRLAPFFLPLSRPNSKRAAHLCCVFSNAVCLTH